MVSITLEIFGPESAGERRRGHLGVQPGEESMNNGSAVKGMTRRYVIDGKIKGREERLIRGNRANDKTMKVTRQWKGDERHDQQTVSIGRGKASERKGKREQEAEGRTGWPRNDN